jgi:histidinol phosphatase-like enzyme
MKDPREKTICFDFDGVIIKKQKYGDGELWEEPVKHAKETLDILSKTYKIVILSVRCNPKARRYYKHEIVHTVDYKMDKMKKWLKKHNIYFDEIVQHKPKAMCYVDDKGYRFTNMMNLLKFINK